VIDGTITTVADSTANLTVYTNNAALDLDSARTKSPKGQNEGGAMQLFMDVHNTLPEGATANDVAAAHEADVKLQRKYNVRYINYWVDENARKVFCLVEAPDREAAHAVHREAHGLVADEIYPVAQG
jgi:hypothetical protein